MAEFLTLSSPLLFLPPLAGGVPRMLSGARGDFPLHHFVVPLPRKRGRKTSAEPHHVCRSLMWTPVAGGS